MSEQAAAHREAQALRAEALALLDRPELAEAACAELLAADPGWRPAADADERVTAAFERARGARLRALLPPLSPPPPPPPRSLQGRLPAPPLYAPEGLLLAEDEDTGPGRWRLALGGGIAFVTPDVDDTLDPGPTAVLEVAYDVIPNWLAVWTQLTITLLSMDDGVAVEPGYTRGLTTASGTVGVMTNVPVAEWLDIALAGGVGVGGFGLVRLGEAVGFAFHASVGVRFRFDRHLGVRVDAVPTLIVPVGGPAGAGGHISLVARGDVRF